MKTVSIEDKTFLLDDDTYSFLETKYLVIRKNRNIYGLYFKDDSVYINIARYLTGIHGTKKKFIFKDGNFLNIQKNNLIFNDESRIKEGLKRFYIRHKNKLQKKQKQAYLNNKNKFLDRNKLYVKNNPDKVKARRAKYLQKEETKKRHAQLRLINKSKDSLKYNSAKNKSRRQDGKPFDFNKIEYLKLIQEGCFYCAKNIRLEFSGVGLDRINNDLGYTKNNVLPCCGSCNKTRGDRHSVYETLVMINALQKLKYKY